MRYQDIGHGRVEALLWLYRDGRVEVLPARGGNTHEACWGMAALEHWRGRYEGESGRVSCIAPGTPGAQLRQLPTWLRDRLEERFGGGVDIIAFNPDGSRSVPFQSLPEDMQVLIADIVENALPDTEERAAVEILESLALPVTMVAVDRFPPEHLLAVETDDRGPGHVADLMAAHPNWPPLVRCGSSFKDGRHRLTAARRLGLREVPVIDLGHLVHCYRRTPFLGYIEGFTE